MRKNRPARRKNVLIEPLEPRTLLSGVTIIAHGAEFLSTARPGWIDSMATAIRNDTGPSTAIYAIRVVPNGSGVKVSSFTKLSGPSPSSNASTNDETVLLLDWAATSAVNLFGLTASYSISKVAEAVIPYLTTAFPSIGLNAPLVEGSIQLIGHSRGVPLVTEIAKDLGQRGIWVDQVTSLDSVPVPPDPGASLKSNVIFADNYYQHSGDGLLTPNGATIAGSQGYGPLTLGGAYGFLDGNTHGDVHLYYYGTINTASKASDGRARVVDSWYANNHTTKQTAGWYYSRLGGGTRTAAGTASAFGGSGSRGSISHSGTQWGNIATIDLSTSKVGEDGAFSADFRYNSFNTAATITWFLDVDTNPYNNNSVQISDPLDVSGTGDSPVSSSADFQLNTTAGIYFLEGRISNTTGTRYDYSNSFVVGNLPPTGVVEKVTAAAISGWADDSDAADVSISIRAESDGVEFYTGAADIERPDLLKKLGSTAHGYSVDLSGLPAGVHKIDIYALDSTGTTSTLIGTRVVYTNQLPQGHFDSYDGTTISGWALDPNSGVSASQIQIKIDGLPPIYATADIERPDLPANQSAHGFSVALPQLKPGNHSVTIYAIDATTSQLVSLGKKSARVLDVVENRLPTGNVDKLTPTLVAGWAFDASTPAASINVRIDIDGVEGTPFAANLTRKDLKSKLKGTDFGFSQSLTLTPGQHKIDVYALDDSTGVPLLLSSKIVGTSSPKGAIEAAAGATASGYAWSAALGGNAAAIRIDVDKYIGNTFVTDVLRDLPNSKPLTTPTINGLFGFNFAVPPVAPGKHTLTLYYIDPLTLAVTKLASKSLVTV